MLKIHTKLNILAIIILSTYSSTNKDDVFATVFFIVMVALFLFSDLLKNNNPKI